MQIKVSEFNALVYVDSLLARGDWFPWLIAVTRRERAAEWFAIVTRRAQSAERLAAAARQARDAALEPAPIDRLPVD